MSTARSRTPGEINRSEETARRRAPSESTNSDYLLNSIFFLRCVMKRLLI